MENNGYVLLDKAGRPQASNDAANDCLGINHLPTRLFDDYFLEKELIVMLCGEKIAECDATVASTGAQVHLAVLGLQNTSGTTLQVTITGEKAQHLSHAGHRRLADRQSPAMRNALTAELPNRHFDLADFSPHGLLLLSSEFEFLAANAAFFDMTHMLAGEACGRGWLAALPVEESQILASALTDADWENSERIERECRLVSPLGELLWVRMIGQRIFAAETGAAGYENPGDASAAIASAGNDSRSNHSPFKESTFKGSTLKDSAGNNKKDDQYNYVLTFDDIHRRKQSDDKNLRLAYYDSLTGLPNRRDFEQVLTECIQERPAMRSILAVLFIDLDGFKQVNDIYGHETGDQLLKKMANTIKSAGSRARKVARLGGDEFTVLLTDVKRIEEVKHFASRLNILLSDSLSIKGVETTVSASIGIAMHHKLIDDRRGPDRIVNDLLRHADEAMYAAKSAGKNCYVFYGNYAKEATHSRSLQSTDNLIREVCRAIKHGELFVEYQPQVATATGNIVSCEALVRWKHHREGLISPAAFVPLVESNGSMGELTIWLIKRICQDVRQFFGSDPGNHPGNPSCTSSGWQDHLSISVNLSPAQIQDMEILEDIDQIIVAESLPKHQFLFEITERTLIADPVAGHNGIEWLRARGYRVSLDDFGTGYSSLAYLHRFPLDEIKLDGSFISDVETSKASRTVVKGVVELAHALGIRVTAEGVERDSQLRFLNQIGCDQWQGYLMSAAVSPTCIRQLITNQAFTMTSGVTSIDAHRPKSFKANTERKLARLT